MIYDNIITKDDPIIYTIETEPTKWSVQRKLEDVVWLYKEILHAFPAIMV